jgi:hypothetical protein
MTLHGDRPSGSRSESPAAKSHGTPNLGSVQTVKQSNSGSDSPAKRTVIEVLNTPSVDSPATRTENGSNGDGYFKDAVPKPAEPTEASSEAVQEKNENAATEPTAASAAPVAEEPKALTPPAERPAAPADDVTMAEAEQAQQPVASTGVDNKEPAPAAEQIQSDAAPAAAAEPIAAEPSAAPATTEPESSAMEVDPPAQPERPATPELPAPPAPTAEAATENTEKKD